MPCLDIVLGLQPRALALLPYYTPKLLLCSCQLLKLLLGLVASLGSLLLALSIDGGGEWVLERNGNSVDDEDPKSEENTSGLSVEKSGSEEAERRTVIHRRAGDVEGEASDHLVLEDAKVVTKEGALDTQLPSGRGDQEIANGEERIGSVLEIFTLESWVRWLITESALVEEVANKAKSEDGHSEGIARYISVAAESPGKKPGAVFYKAVLCQIFRLLLPIV